MGKDWIGSLQKSKPERMANLFLNDFYTAAMSRCRKQFQAKKNKQNGNLYNII